ncbi:MAG TPA: 2-oxo acid dehydrogenase subunit E2 [Steroidobacteraceae bacterium]|jgi:pyruvate dehydrogenase E2 component (dihydrolipoamide acetyltransferase)|nr:2-oxo acid dehydrogenase subunit E2 [Steroidobacteraceae bacterium]
MAREVEVRVPDMGDFKDVTVIDVLIKPGDSIEAEAPLVTLETEKAAMDVPSTVAGVVEKVHVSKASKVSTGDLLATVRAQDDAPAATAKTPAPPLARPVAAPAAAPASALAPAPPAPSEPARSAAPVALNPNVQPVFNELGFSKAHASPSVRKLARELGVDLSQVKGTGPKARISHEDVKAFVKGALSGAAAAAAGAAWPAVPTVDFSQFGPVESKPLSRIQRISGPRLHASWVNIPHVTQFESADITDLEDVRIKLKQKALSEGIRLSILAFVVRACARALQEFPHFNASLDARGENLIVKKYINIGFAADTEHGLLVPVLRNVEHRDIYEIARQVAELALKARAGKLTAAEMQGGSFTISSLGGIGGTSFTPIINAPEVAILGLSRSSLQPVFRDGGFVPRLLLPLSLSYDHRVIDGASAARFTTFLAARLAEPRGLVEAVP